MKHVLISTRVSSETFAKFQSLAEDDCRSIASLLLKVVTDYVAESSDSKEQKSLDGSEK